MGKAYDVELELFVELVVTLSSDYLGDGPDPWEGSPFAWIKTRPSRQRGAIGELLIERWLTAKGAKVRRSGTSDFDRAVNGHRMEIKFSTLWVGGQYTFQQIRDQAYDHVICLGIAPADVACWVIPKAVVMAHAGGQHTGSGGTDTAWFSFPADAPPDWLHPFGGTLTEAWEIIVKLGMGAH